MPFDELRGGLAEAEYRRILIPSDVFHSLGRGRPGSATLRRAFAQHLPLLAQTRSVLENRFLLLCERAGIAMPEVNVRVAGLTVDALWRDERVVVELDGKVGHGTDVQMERDRSRDLRLRAAGCTVLRYTWQQVTRESRTVVSDLRAALAGRH